ncbi:putative transcription factor C2H2 family [Rosa chinensis]|uniref:Putative transcription factor C2H2 family n=1 Tax=Rosa chinensis TaxID=74649 RepID=A0A2P6RH67_ROSCH|nr:RING-H2 finger protein ATL43 [Rosa chinensis]PRQ45761.1 putative transcription factor C2H2 family [Rosa chinensis]
MAIMVGVLMTLFSFMFLLLLYAKHCKRGSFVVIGGTTDSRSPGGVGLRKNSGIDQVIVDSLPVFQFRSLREHKDGLECTVCLTRIEPTEVLRLLSKCKHPFHVECVDKWLDAHSTCLLCRCRVDPEVPRQLDLVPEKNRTRGRRRKPRTSEKRQPPFKPRQNEAGAKNHRLLPQIKQYRRWWVPPTMERRTTVRSSLPSLRDDHKRERTDTSEAGTKMSFFDRFWYLSGGSKLSRSW